MGVIDNAVSWAVQIANDDSHSYSRSVRWGPSYDCSSFVISAYDQAGVPVKSGGATYTGNMKRVFLDNGFEDVTSSVNLSNGSGLKKGDVLLNETHHAALVQEDGGKIVHSSSPSNGIVANRNYYNYPWDCVLRYMNDSSVGPKKKILLNPGHGYYKNGTYDSGATGCGYEEAKLTRELVRMIESNLSGYADITVWDYDKDIYNYNPDLNYDEFEYCLSIHFDAGGGSGSMVIRHRSRDRNSFETALLEKVTAAGGFSARPDSTQGLQFTSNSPKNTTLLEVCYIDNQSDMDKYQAKKSEIAKAIADALISSFGLTYGGGESYWDANWVEKELPNNPIALKEKTYERYWKITAQGTTAYQISRTSDASTHSTGLRVYKNDFLIIALGSYYGPTGTFAKIKFDNGNEIVCVKGDEKDDRETNTEHPAHSYHVEGAGVVEANYISVNLLEVQADTQSSSWQQEFLKAFDEYCGCASASITNIWVSDTEPRWVQGSGGGTGTDKIEYHFTDTNEKIPLHPTLFNQPEITPPDNDLHVYIGTDEGPEDIVDYAGNLAWKNATRTLATDFTFSVAKTRTDYVKQKLYEPKIGDIVRYYADKKELYRGMIIDIDYGSTEHNGYTAMDAGWWLNKSQDTYQFTDADSTDAITKILTDLSIPIAFMSDTLTAKISGVFVNEYISDIILNILDQNGGQYNFDVIPEGIRIYKYGEIIADPKWQFAPNTYELDSLEWRGAETHTGSIDEVKNSIKVISETDVLAVVKDCDSYNNYGFLQEVVQIDPDKVSDPQQYAADRLAVMSQAKETLSFRMIEGHDSYTRAGEVMTFGEYDFVIQSTAHSIKNNIHYNDIDLWRWRKVEKGD